MKSKATHRIRGGLDGAYRARVILSEILSGLIPERPELQSDLRLLVSELATNSLLHGGVREQDEFVLEIELGEAIRITVTDRGDGFDPEESRRRPATVGGYGLILVERIADRWGVTRDGGATSVWFELDMG